MISSVFQQSTFNNVDDFSQFTFLVCIKFKIKLYNAFFCQKNDMKTDLKVSRYYLNLILL